MTARQSRRVVILDDDPTGTQTASNVPVVLEPSPWTIGEVMDQQPGSFYVLTNTRSLPRKEATRYLRTIIDRLEAAASTRGEDLAPVLRGDSTLRGHVFAEISVLESAHSVTLFVPAFPEGGRVTRDGVQYLRIDGEEVPVAKTEFARDATFGFDSVELVDWVAEVGDGQVGISLPLSEMRMNGPDFVAAALIEAPDHAMVIPDAETADDLSIVLDGLRRAETAGRHVVVRSAATFAAMRAGIQGAAVQSIAMERDGPVAVICGSHTSASTAQLEDLIVKHDLRVVEVASTAVAGQAEAATAGENSGIELRRALESSRSVVLRTPRVVAEEASDLISGTYMMTALIEAARHVRDLVSGVVVKGGITSAKISTDVFESRKAQVVGQLEAGVPLWRLHIDNSEHDLPYAVVPGNVGDCHTLTRVVSAFGL